MNEIIGCHSTKIVAENGPRDADDVGIEFSIAGCQFSFTPEQQLLIA
jgi:hypothetical protein